MPASNDEAILNELIAIKKLMIFALLRQPGITQTDVASAIGTSQAQISRMFARTGAKSTSDVKER